YNIDRTNDEGAASEHRLLGRSSQHSLLRVVVFRHSEVAQAVGLLEGAIPNYPSGVRLYRCDLSLELLCLSRAETSSARGALQDDDLRDAQLELSVNSTNAKRRCVEDRITAYDVLSCHGSASLL